MPLPLDHYSVRLRLGENMLGTVPKNRTVYATHIATKGREMLEKQAKKGIPLASGIVATDEAIEAAIAEEVETVEELEERGWTTFHADERGPFLFDYLIKGFLCESARALKQHGNMKQLADKVKRFVFVTPRKIRLPEIAGCIERPLRAITAQGPRVTVVRSDYIAAGTELHFDLAVLRAEGVAIKRPTLIDILEYGRLQGLGQWRSGGHGTFVTLHCELRGDESPQREVGEAA